MDNNKKLILWRFGILVLVSVIMLPFVLSGACNTDWLNSQVIAYYPMNKIDLDLDNLEKTESWDGTSVPNGYPTLATSQPFPSGVGIDFEASSSQYYTGGNTADVEIENYTIGVHVIPEVAPPDHGVIWGTLENTGGWQGSILQIKTDGKLVISEYNAGSNNYAQSTTTVTHGKHYYLTWFLGSGIDKIYINNSEVSYSNQDSASASYNAGQHQSNIGAYDSAGQPFDGIIGELVIINGELNSTCRDYIQSNSYPYNYTLESEILSYWTFDSDATDYYNALNGTAQGDTNYASSGIINNGADFDGTDDEITFPADTRLHETDGTICSWVQYNNAGISSTIFNSQKTASDYWIPFRQDSTELELQYRNGVIGTLDYFLVDDFTISAGQWNHICVITNGNNWSVFINGTQHNLLYNGFGTNEGNWFNGGVTATYSIGERVTDQDFDFDGMVDEMAIWNRTLSDTEVYQVFNTSLNGIRFYATDSTPPVITLSYPVNNTRYNLYNGSIIFNATDDSSLDNCSINDSDWDLYSSDGTWFHYNRTTTPDGNYSVTINCNDTIPNTETITFNFLVDTTYPAITVFSPLNDTYYNSDILMNISYHDLYLYLTKTSIARNDSLMDSIQLHSGTLVSGDITSLYSFDGSWYNISENGGTVLFINYTDVYNFTGVQVYYEYQGNPAHNMYLAFWNYDTQAWDSYIQLDSGFIGWENYSFTKFGIDGYVYVNNLTNVVQMRINHTSPPNNVHWTALDIVSINGTERYHYLNESDVLFTEYYNISELWNTSLEPDGTYQILFEATDTHTSQYFDDGWVTEEGYTNNMQNYFKKYYMNYGEIEFITPIGLEIDDYRDTDRIRQDFNSLLDTDLDEIEIEINADKIEYFENSEYPCHLIINEHYWYDCLGLNNAEIIDVKSQSAKFKFNHIEHESISDSLGGLNYLNLTYTIYLDKTAPILNNYTVTNATSSLQWELYFSENTTYDYTVGLNCSDDSVDDGTGNNTELTVTNLVLNSSTSYYMFINLTDFALNNNNYCINGTTLVSGVDYALIQSIVNAEIQAEVNNLNEAIMFFVIILLWAILFFIAYKTDSRAMVLFTMIFGVFYAIWLWNNSDVPRLIVATFGVVNMYFLAYTFMFKK